ncbi:hypothetical protein [Evansella cellulosilytica]|nr:hypothetical protein [Evansella cellulosilytica]
MLQKWFKRVFFKKHQSNTSQCCNMEIKHISDENSSICNKDK